MTKVLEKNSLWMMFNLILKCLCSRNTCIIPWLASHLSYLDDLDVCHREKHLLITFWHVITLEPTFRKLPFWSTEDSTWKFLQFNQFFSQLWAAAKFNAPIFPGTIWGWMRGWGRQLCFYHFCFAHLLSSGWVHWDPFPVVQPNPYQSDLEEASSFFLFWCQAWVRIILHYPLPMLQ